MQLVQLLKATADKERHDVLLELLGILAALESPEASCGP